MYTYKKETLIARREWKQGNYYPGVGGVGGREAGCLLQSFFPSGNAGIPQADDLTRAIKAFLIDWFKIPCLRD